jgi:hypothetical protein
VNGDEMDDEDDAADEADEVIESGDLDGAFNTSEDGTLVALDWMNDGPSEDDEDDDEVQAAAAA